MSWKRIKRRHAVAAGRRMRAAKDKGRPLRQVVRGLKAVGEVLLKQERRAVDG